MKLYTYQQNNDGADRLGVSYGKTPDQLWPVEAFGLSFANMTDLIRNITPGQFALLSNAENAPADAAVALDAVHLRAPIPYPEQDVLCLGVNYADHAEESARFHAGSFKIDKKKAVYFSKRVNEASGASDPIPSHEGLVEELDYEVELGVIIGRDCRNVTEQEVEDVIFGYTVINDVSARDLQTTHNQWYFGKSLDGFTPMGPCILTADEVAFPPALTVSSTVNGEPRQHSNTDLFIHTITDIITELTRGMTLRAGTVIATGTPAGVGMGFVPPKFLKKGDKVICAVEGIGALTNIVE